MPNATEDLDRLLAQIASKKPDIVEFRIDKLADAEAVQAIGRKNTLPAIATRHTQTDSRVDRDLLLAAADSGFEFVDIDTSKPDAYKLAELCKTRGAKIIASSHNFEGTPPRSELDKTLDSVKRIRFDVCKIVTTATHSHDNLVLLNFLEERREQVKLISFAMGALGIPSRILSPVYGAEFAFAALSRESRTADGQPTIDELREAWSILGIQ
jgi:3-dehydroquinate dehydratase-1